MARKRRKIKEDLNLNNIVAQQFDQAAALMREPHGPGGDGCMFASAARERFTAMVELDDDDIDLLAASILIAQEEYPEISVREHVRTVDRIGERLQEASQRLGTVILHQDCDSLRGLRGSSSRSYSPRRKSRRRLSSGSGTSSCCFSKTMDCRS